MAIKKYRNFIFIGIVLIFCLLILEFSAKVFLGLRKITNTLILTGDERIYEHKPSITFINRYGIEVKYNSLGFIGDEIGPKTEQTFRILGVGDSITDGTYLPEEERYLNKLSRILEARTNRNIEIINSAVGGYNTWQELEIIKEKGLSVKPDLIIVGICLNDYIEQKPSLKRAWFGRIIENFNDGSRARYFNFLYQRSAFYKILYDFFSNIRRTGYGQKDYRRYLEEYDFDIKSPDFQKWQKPFIEIMMLAKKHKIKILFVIFPLHNQIVKRENISYKPLSDFFKEEGAHSLDLMKYFNDKSQAGNDLFIRRDIIHLNALGHRITAEAIANYVLKNKMLE